MAALSTTALLGITAAAGTLGQFAGQRRAAGQARREGDYQAQLLSQNAELAELQAKDAIARGTESELRQRGQTRGTIGAQRAALAAQGIAVDSGSAGALQSETALLGELDALTIRNNAAREAWGYRVQGSQFQSQAVLAAQAGRNQAAALREESFGTLLTGLGQGINIWQNRPRPAIARGPMARAAPQSSLDALNGMNGRVTPPRRRKY